MARAAQQKVYADFRQGFVTVANPLAYPEGSLKDIVNFDIQDNGTLRLRPGLQQESSVAVSTDISYSDVEDIAITSHLWLNVNNKGEDKIAVIQTGSFIQLYPVYKDRIALEEPLDKIDLEIPSESRDIAISGTSGAGWFFIAHPGIKTKILKRDSFDGTFSVEDIEIQIRDLSLWRGRTDKETGLEKDNTLYPMHSYNLRNGGWPDSCYVSLGSNADDGAVKLDPVRYTFAKVKFYPPVSLPFLAGKAGGGDTLVEQNAYNPWAIETDYYGNSLIPLGHFIVNAEEWTRKGSGNSFLEPSVSESRYLNRTYKWTSYPSSTEFYSGRVWYAGAKGYQESDTPYAYVYDKKDGLDVSNTIYFSQELNSDMEKVGYCYQANDPTAEDLNALLPTDGGTITIRGAGTILSLKTFGTALIVFATEGVWAITGLDANSFNADSFSVDKLSNIGPTSVSTIASTNKDIYYIADDALYALSVDEVSGKPTPVDITSARIKDFYNDIPFSQKQKARAFYDATNRNLYMLYSDNKDLLSSKYNKALVFNRDLGCFYKYDLASLSRSIFDGLFYTKDKVSSLNEPIVVGTEPVELDGEPVVISTSFSTESSNTIQLLTVKESPTNTIEFSFSSFSDTSKFEDWGEAYEGVVEFGFDTAGDIMRDSIKAPVIVSHLERTEDGFEADPEDPTGGSLIPTHPSSCKMYYGWDWAERYIGGTELYRLNRNYVPYGVSDPFDYGKSVISCKNRIRGKGHSLGIKLTAGYGRDCRLLGIGILYTAANRV